MELFEALIHTDPSVGITWVDAPTAQYARVHTDHKLRCKVQANPAANIDWLKESVIISSGELSIYPTHVFNIVECYVYVTLPFQKWAVRGQGA